MTAHVSDDLPRLLTGEAPRDVVLDAAAHLRTCTDCQQALVLAVVAHASLTSARRFAPEIVGRAVSPELAPTETTPELPNLSSMFAQVREDASAPRNVHNSRRLRFGLVAAAAAVVIGGGSYVIVNETGSTAPAPQTVALQAFDRGKTPATVSVHTGGQMDINAAALPNLGSRHYEVWLTNTKRTEMQPIGWLNSDGKASLTVPQSLWNRFTDIEVSVQDVASENYTYSGTSVLRGAYT